MTQRDYDLLSEESQETHTYDHLPKETQTYDPLSEETQTHAFPSNYDPLPEETHPPRYDLNL